MTQVKFCGLKDIKIIQNAIKLGVDYLGFVFVPSSKRFIDQTQLETISRFFQENPGIKSNSKLVALFANPERRMVQNVIDYLHPDILQFHAIEDNYETPEFCRSFNLPYIKAIPFGKKNILWHDYEARFYDAFALLADAHGTQQGGSGISFDWSRIPEKKMRKLPLFLAGGLNENNVSNAILSCAPLCVDVASGIEVSTGVKSYERMCAFMSQINKKQ